MDPLSSHLPSLGYSVVSADRQPSVLPLGLCNELRALVSAVFVCVSVSLPGCGKLGEVQGNRAQRLGIQATVTQSSTFKFRFNHNMTLGTHLTLCA